MAKKQKLNLAGISDAEAVTFRKQKIASVPNLSFGQKVVILDETGKQIVYDQKDVPKHIDNFLRTGKDAIGKHEITVAKEEIAYDKEYGSSS